MKIILSLLILSLAPLLAQQQVSVQPDCFIAFTFPAGSASFPATVVNNGPGDNRQKGCSAWTMKYQSTGYTVVSVQVDSGADTGTAPTFGAFAGTVKSGFANPVVSNTGGETQLTNGTATISWVRVTATVTGAGALTGVLYGWRNSSAAVVNAGGTVTSLSAGAGITLTPNPITTTGTITNAALPAGSANSIQVKATATTLGDGNATNGAALLGNSVATGSELITNGGFVGGTTGWTLASGDIVYGTNDVVCTYATNCGVSQNTLATVSGQYYLVKFTVSSASVYGRVSFSFANNTFSSNAYNNGAQAVLFLASFTGTDTITFNDAYANFFGGTDSWTLTGISVKNAISTVSGPLTLTGPMGQSELVLNEYNNLNNIGIGAGVLSSTTGINNVALGTLSLFANTSGFDNTGFGFRTLYANTTGFNNTAVGNQSLTVLITGQRNTGVGSSTMADATTASFNTAVGEAALAGLTTGAGNTAIGRGALGANFITTTGNTAIGREALASLNGGTGGNVAIGYNAGTNQTTGSNLLIIDNQNRGSAGAEAASALLYGTFNATATSQILDVNAQLVQNVNAINPFIMVKNSTTATAPAAGFADLRWIAGTNAGTCKLVGAAGTSATEVTIVDNVGSGC